MGLIHDQIDEADPGCELYWELVEYLANPQDFLDKYYPARKEQTLYETDCLGRRVRSATFVVDYGPKEPT